MPVSTTLRGRGPGQALIARIVSAQKDAAPRSTGARIFGVNPIAASKRALYRAALGELAVGEMLDQLGPKWDVLHVIPILPVGDNGTELPIDHLVIGPSGVFALLTENYPGQEVRVTGDEMTIGGREVDDIRDARELAAVAGERLSAATGRTIVVTPIIVVIDSGKLGMREEPTGVFVIPAKQLLRLLAKFDRSLTGTEVADISDVADRDTTWEFTPTSAEDAQQLSHDFSALRSQVRDAGQTRGFWFVVSFAIICTSAWYSTLLIVERLLGH